MRFPFVVGVLTGLSAVWLVAQGRVTGTPVPGAERPMAVTVPAGTEFDVKVAGPAALGSATVKNDQRFEAVTLVDVMVGRAMAVPAGSIVRGFVGSFKSVSPVNRQGSITLAFDELRVGEADKPIRLRATVVQVFDPKISEDLARIGPAAVTPGAAGGVLGTGKAPLSTVFVSAGVIVSAHAGDLKLPPGVVLRLRLDQSVTR